MHQSQQHLNTPFRLHVNAEDGTNHSDVHTQLHVRNVAKNSSAAKTAAHRRFDIGAHAANSWKRSWSLTLPFRLFILVCNEARRALALDAA